jgi:hypothetical protein
MTLMPTRHTSFSGRYSVKTTVISVIQLLLQGGGSVVASRQMAKGFAGVSRWYVREHVAMLLSSSLRASRTRHPATHAPRPSKQAGSLKDAAPTLPAGNNRVGAVGDGTTVNVLDLPVLLAGDGTWVDISAGLSSSCALAANGSASCWGGCALHVPPPSARRLRRRRGPQTRTAPCARPRGLVAVVRWLLSFAGDRQTTRLLTMSSCLLTVPSCLLTCTSPHAASPPSLCLLAAGLNRRGKLGTGDLQNSRRPVPVTPGFVWSKIYVGDYSTW